MADDMNVEQGMRISREASYKLEIPEGPRTIKEGEMTREWAIKLLKDLGAIQEVTIIPVIVHCGFLEPFVVEMNSLDNSVGFLRNRIAEKQYVKTFDEAVLFVVGEGVHMFTDHTQLLDEHTIGEVCNVRVFENARCCPFYTTSGLCVAASI